ncbi:thioesterase II family protein [Streptomyces sp. NPDC056921]|uniref:thioesterase II family protein n=1 Tax=Streptomyces sp. NPDC056921 TaxID=3345966 RepID=UPI0036398E0B
MPQTYLRVGNADAPVRLLAFHHAGGSASSFLPIAQIVQMECESLLFELAGRDEGEREFRSPDFTAAVERFAADFRAAVDRPTVIIAHSMGAILAHQLVSSLAPRQREAIRVVVVSSARSPRSAERLATMPTVPFGTRTRESVRDDLRRYGGCPPELFDDSELVAHFVDVLGHDLHLADTYAPTGGQPIGIPYQVWYGTEDEALTAEDMRSWDDESSDGVTFHGFPGGHFYLFERPEAPTVLRRLVAEIVAET